MKPRKRLRKHLPCSHARAGWMIDRTLKTCRQQLEDTVCQLQEDNQKLKDQKEEYEAVASEKDQEAQKL